LQVAASCNIHNAVKKKEVFARFFAFSKQQPLTA